MVGPATDSLERLGDTTLGPLLAYYWSRPLLFTCEQPLTGSAITAKGYAHCSVGVLISAYGSIAASWSIGPLGSPGALVPPPAAIKRLGDNR